MNTLFNYRYNFNQRLRASIHLAPGNQSSILRQIALRIWLKTRSKYDFSAKEYNKLRINQLLNPKTVLYYKYKEMLIQEDSEEFIQCSFDFEHDIKSLIIELISFYSNNLHFLPNYLPLQKEYSILLNWMKSKQKCINDINHLNSSHHFNNNDMSITIHNSIELLDNCNNKSGDIKGRSKYKLPLSKDNHFFKNKGERANESIESLEKFTHYLNIFDDHYFTPRKREPLLMTPKKKEVANVLLYAKSNFLITMNNTISNHKGMMGQNALKESQHQIKLIKPKMFLKKKLTHKGNPDKFLPTEAFFDNLKDRGMNSVKFTTNTDQYIEIRKCQGRHSSTSSSKMTPSKCTLVSLNLNKNERREMRNGHEFPCLINEKTFANTKAQYNHTIENKKPNLSHRTKQYHLRGFSDTPISQLHCLTMASTILRKKKYNEKKMKSVSTFNANSEGLESIIKKTFNKTKVIRPSQNKWQRDKKQNIYLRNINQIRIGTLIKN